MLTIQAKRSWIFEFRGDEQDESGLMIAKNLQLMVRTEKRQLVIFKKLLLII